MRKTIGAFLVFLGVLLVAASLLSVLLNILPSIYVALSTGAAYAWGRVTGGLVVTVLFFLLGRKAFKAGRARFVPAPTVNAQPTVQADGPASGGSAA